jgi:hypothetical protein
MVIILLIIIYCFSVNKMHSAELLTLNVGYLLGNATVISGFRIWYLDLLALISVDTTIINFKTL